MNKTLLTACLVLSASAMGLAAEKPDPKTERFGALLKKVQTDPGGTKEAEARELLKLSKELGTSYQASLALRGYLSHNFKPSPELLLATAEAAYRAGDYTYAVVRYKNYLDSARPGGQASQAAATLYTLLVDFLDAEEDAYQFMVKNGSNLRGSAAAKRYDTWFLAKARAKKDYAAAARGLADAMGDKMPLVQERMFLWDHLDWLMTEISQADRQHFAALPHCRKIVPLVRDDKPRAARYAFLVANLAYHAGAAGKDDRALAREFELVARAAMDYVKADPSAETVEAVVRVFAGGLDRFDGNAWERQKEQKRDVFVKAFGRLPDDDRVKIMSWTEGNLPRYLATTSQWAELGRKHAKLFASTDATRYIPLPVNEPASRAEYAELAAFCKDAASEDAAVISALASSDDLKKVLDYLMKHHAWHLAPDRYYSVVGHQIMHNFRRIHETDKKKLPAGTTNDAWVYFGEKYIAASPIAIYDAEAVKSYLRAAWHAAAKDRSAVGKHLDKLAWAPFDRTGDKGRNARQDVYSGIAGEGRKWLDSLRKEAKKKAKDRKVKDLKAQLKAATDLQATLRKVRTGAEVAKAPNPLCRSVAEMVSALNERDHKKYLQAAHRVYKLVRQYEDKKTPYGRALVAKVSEARGQKFEELDLQLTVLADQLAQMDSEEVPEGAETAMREILGSHSYEWRLFDSHSRHRKTMLKINAVLAKAMLSAIDKGRFPERVFSWFRGTRKGRGWDGGKAGQDVMAKIIEKRLLHSSGYRVTESTPSATVTCMRLVRYEFPELAKKYPVETYFDDMFVKEARDTKYLDWTYWEFGRDEKGKVAAAAADILASRDRLPVVATDDEPVYSLADISRWMNVALKADGKAREKLLAKCDATYGTTRFDPYAMGYGHFTNGMDLAKAAGRKEFFQRLATYLKRSEQAPARLGLPPMPQLDKLADKDKELTDAELDVLTRVFTQAPSPHWTRNSGYDTAIELVHNGLLERDRGAELFELVGHFWKVARDVRDHNTTRGVAKLVDGLRKDERQDLALAYSSVGLEMLKDRLPTEVRTALGGVRTWALAEMGGVIPVAKGHPLRSLYEAQLAYLTGKYQTAWETYTANRRRMQQSFKEFDPQFAIWLIEKETEFRNFDLAERLAKEMMAWFDDVSERFEAEVRGRLQLAYADIALEREDRPRARALYERIVANNEFAGTRAQLDAELKIADVDTKDGIYDRAMERLEGLARRPSRYLQTEAAYYMARVKFAQEEFAEAKDRLGQVFTLSPDHAEGRILEGKVNLKLKKLEQPTDIDLGEKIGKKFIVPGRPVRVTLVDHNLSVVRKATEIEIRAWTDAGDEEFFALSPFGDSKTTFKGRLATELGPVKKGDHTIQVIGRDRVHYAFSDRFAEAQQIEDNEPFTLAVATDAELYAASGRILSREEREARALEEMIRKRMGEDAPEPDAVPLSTVRAEDQIKPGNKINVRVIDADRGITRKPDKLTVRLATASGDAIDAFELVETEPHSGIFEGAVPTEAAQATAYASDSQEGTEPSFAISAKKYPAWVGLPRPSKSRPKTFSVDLNDNVSLGTMKVVAKEPARKLKSFLVQTSFNGRDFTTVGAWPEPFKPWDGKATLTVARYVHEDDDARGRLVAPRTVRDFRDYFEQGCIREGQRKVAKDIKTLSAKWDWKIDGMGPKIGTDGNPKSTKYYVAHLKAAFYQPRRQMRTFTLHPTGEVKRDRPVSYILTVDGEPAAVRRTGDGEEVIEAKGPLAKGVHVVEVFVFAHHHGNPVFEVTCDTTKPPYQVPCPPEMFDAAKHPEIAKGLAREVAEVAADKDGTEFAIAFPEAARARVVRLLLTDFESDAPAINKVTLTDAAGERVLPTKHDFLALRENGVLEIVPGDRITVTYEDPKVLTAGEELQEAFLTATYTNATLSACFVEYEIDDRGEREARYIAMRRFSAGDKINVFIQDPDCDVSDKLDTVKFVARTTEGKPVTLEALETEEHSGTFLGSLFPIAGKPQRESELTVKEGDDVILTYMDRENTDPGIPWSRTFAVEQVWFEKPEIRVYDVTSLPLDEADKLAGRKGAASKARRRTPAGAPGENPIADENVPVRRTLLAVRPEQLDDAKAARMVIGGPLLVEVLFPAIAKSEESTCTLYAQTATAREAMGKKEADGAFDVNVPGTLKLTETPGDVAPVEPPPGYRDVIVHGNPYALEPLDDGRFVFSIPVRLGSVPEKTLINAVEEAAAMGEDPEDLDLALSINGQDEIYIGMNYKDPDGNEHWVTRTVSLTGDMFFDVMDRRYQEPLEGVYVGETMYVRVIDPTRDANDAKNAVQIELTTSAGRKKTLDLIETFSHSGVFKGLATVVHADDKAALDAPSAVASEYGDRITAVYARGEADDANALAKAEVEVYKGADGGVVPFTKRFKDPRIAVETQFMIAEAYFELAKRHRELGQDDIAREEIARGRKLLQEALRDFPHTSARAQAEYLLADLSLEFGNDAKDDDGRKKHYMDAITRYSDIVASYPDSEYAPKAQFRKALAYEKMEMLDEACEEYVKLSYRYPDNPLVAETIARLGQYFLNKGRGIRAEAEKLTDAVEREKTRLEAAEMFQTAGQVFSRLSVRFPNHRLAGKTMLLSAQCYMQAEDFDEAVEHYLKVVRADNMDNDLIAEGMYWCGHSYMETNDLVKAYQMFKKLTWDYPATKWAKFARGRLADEKLANIEE